MCFQCPFCHEGQTVRCGEFPYVRSQLIVMFERCAGLPAGTSVYDLVDAAGEMADVLLAATYIADAQRLMERQTHHL
jgi:hypothetical protein